jgi:hypothetical protein
MKKVLWIGPIVRPSEVVKYKAVSAAANIWQLGFIDGLIQNGIKGEVVSYIPYPSWPKGPLWAKRPLQKINNNEFQQYYFGYLNIIFLREFCIAFMIVFLSLIKISDVKEHIVFTYNPYQRHWFAAICLRLIFRCKWVSIIADNRSIGNPDFYLFLSFDYFNRFKKRNKLFCDGGITIRDLELEKEYFKCDLSEAPKSLVFAGTLNNWTGIIDFIDLFNEVDTENYVLHIYGKGDQEILKKKNKLSGNKVILHGFVSDHELDQACRNAYAFINPRPLQVFRSENNFPSKLLLYLSYNKPIISTKTKGLSPDYDNILFYYSDSETLKECFKLINNRANYQNMVTKISRFNPDNTWVKKVRDITSSLGI